MFNIRKNFFKSFQFRITLIAVFVIASVILIYFLFGRDSKEPNNSILNNTEVNTDSSKTVPPEQKNLSQFLDRGVDSVLFCFGIKKEWITTNVPGNTKPVKGKTDLPKKTLSNAQWFTKSVLIPKDLTSAEVNLDLTALIKNAELFSIVNEDIKTTDIEINIYKDSASVSGTPLVRISVNHTDKINRESGTLVVILSNLGEMKKEQIDEILNSTNEFSFVLPRNLEDIELQNKLIHEKKDIIISVTVGEKEAVETDFHAGMEEKEIKQKVKSFNVDFPSVKYVLLSALEPGVEKDKIYSTLTAEFAKFDIKAISDSSFFKLPDVELSSSQVQSVINTLKAKVSTAGKVTTVLSMDYDAFKSFYNEVLTLKKQGFKFYNVTQYLSKEADRQKREKLLKEKQEEEAKKKKETKTAVKDKKTEKKAPADTKNKKTDTKKKVTTTKKK